MNESVVIGKEVDAKKVFSSAHKRDKNIHRVRDKSERQLDSLKDVIGNIRRDGETPSVENIATNLSRTHAAHRTPALLALQQTHGNQYVQRVAAGIQAKLVVGQPGDVYEQEADRVADAVMRMPKPGVQRQVEPEEEEDEEEMLQAKPLTKEITQLVQRQIEPEEEEEEETLQSKPLANQITPLVQVQRQEEPEEEEEMLQAKPLAGQITQLVQRQVEPEEEEEEEMLQVKSREDATSEVPNDLESQINAIRGGGRPLAESERAYFEPRFGADFSQVRLHTDSQAAESTRAVNARAFTVGQDVVFGAGQYAQGASEGQRLMAHELTHVVQQSGKNKTHNEESSE